MSAFGFALVLTASVCHATWNYFVKRINGGPELVWLFSVVSSIIFLPVAIWVLVTSPPLTPLGLVFIGGSGIVHIAYFLLLQEGYRRGDLSIVYPTARATGPLLSASFAVIVLGETMTPMMALGAGIIIGGVLMLTGGFRRRGAAAGTSLGFGLSVGVLIGIYTVWDAHAVATVMVPPLLQDYGSGLVRTVVLTPLGWRRRASVRRLWAAHWPGVLVVAVFSVLAYVLVLTALTFTPVVYVAPIRETSVVLSVLIGSLLLHEGNLRARLTWGAVIFGGVVVLALSH